jgi:PPK2 family polyphosphate:nucleotide phosphotransferase
VDLHRNAHLLDMMEPPMPHDITPYRIPDGGPANLAERPTKVEKWYESTEDYERQLRARTLELRELQSKLYAQDQHALLVIFQAMDAAGKDGAIKHVLSGINPQGCQVFSFKRPSAEELDHDFLWRTARCLPERGRIGIFNRSYYEEVLVVRVNPAILRGQNLPPERVNEATIWQERFESISDHERHLHRNGTTIVKFYLHMSKEEQRERLLARIDEPDKNWKFETGDLAARAQWDDYMHAYDEALSATSAAESPWYAVPADSKKNARLIISEVLIQTLRDLKVDYPEATPEHVAELQRIREELAG